MNNKLINEIIEELKEILNNKRFGFYITTERAVELANSLAKIKNIELADEMWDEILERIEIEFLTMTEQNGNGFLLSKNHTQEAIENLIKYENISHNDPLWYEINKYL